MQPSEENNSGNLSALSLSNGFHRIKNAMKNHSILGINASIYFVLPIWLSLFFTKTCGQKKTWVSHRNSEGWQWQCRADTDYMVIIPMLLTVMLGVVSGAALGVIKETLSGSYHTLIAGKEAYKKMHRGTQKLLNHEEQKAAEERKAQLAELYRIV